MMMTMKIKGYDFNLAYASPSCDVENLKITLGPLDVRIVLCPWAPKDRVTLTNDNYCENCVQRGCPAYNELLGNIRG